MALREMRAYEGAMDDLEKSIQIYSKKYDINSMSASEWCKKGMGLCKIKSYNEALDAFNRALELNPSNGKALYNKGIVLRWLGKTDEAKLYIEKAVEIFDNKIKANPENSRFWYNKGIALRDLEKYKEALDAFERAIEINPSFTKAWIGKGIVYDRVKKHQKAMEAYERAVDINPIYSDLI